MIGDSPQGQGRERDAQTGSGAWVRQRDVDADDTASETGSAEALPPAAILALLLDTRVEPMASEQSERLWARIERARHPTQAITRRAGQGLWLTIRSGIRVKPLHTDSKAGYRSFLMRLDPGAEYPAHQHHHDEECVVLDGDVCVGDLELSVGDYHLAPAGVDHQRLTSRRGATLFLRSGIVDTEPETGERWKIAMRTIRDQLRSRLPFRRPSAPGF